MADDTPWWEVGYTPGWPAELQEQPWWQHWVRSHGRCEYCGLDATADARLLAVLDGDHIVPNGSNDPLNIAMACRVCNNIKKKYDPSDGKGSPQTHEERDRLIKKAWAEICKRVNQRAPWEHPRYFRIWQLTEQAARSN